MSITIESTEDGRPPAEHGRATVLHPVDRIMELLFGLLMALSFTGALSVAQSGRTEIREMFVAAFGCNLAWGIVDAVMYLIRTRSTAPSRSPCCARSGPRPTRRRAGR